MERITISIDKELAEEFVRIPAIVTGDSGRS